MSLSRPKLSLQAKLAALLLVVVAADRGAQRLGSRMRSAARFWRGR